jgi:hypothetical protein
MGEPYRRKKGRSAIARIFLRLEYRPAPEGIEGECWIFLGAKRRGYGTINVDGRLAYTHQITYEALIGPRPEGEPDHLCKTKECCNPWHLRYGPHGDNMLTIRGTLSKCRRGHDRDKYGKTSGRGCAECAREDHRAYMKARSHQRRKTNLPNNKDKTECKNGHPFTPENTIYRPTGRMCRTCQNEANRRYRKNLGKPKE